MGHAKVRRLVLTGRPLQYPDHDFRSSSYQITPSGNVFLLLRPEDFAEGEEEFEWAVDAVGVPPSAFFKCIKDMHGRLRVPIPRSGHLYIRLRGSPWFSATSEIHAVDIVETIGIEFPDGHNKDLLSMVDNAADQDRESLRVQLTRWRIFRELKLATYATVSYAPGCSYCNPIERFFHYFSVTDGSFLDEILPDDVLPPNKQSDLSAIQVDQKERALYGPCFTLIETEWGKILVGGQFVHVRRVDGPLPPNPAPADPPVAEEVSYSTCNAIVCNRL
jgi:hypothetical protein